MELNVQVSGYAQKIIRISGIHFRMIVMYPTRTKHQKIIITNMGTEDFPAPGRIQAMQWENARRK